MTALWHLATSLGLIRCGCGCGERVKPGNRFLPAHHMRSRRVQKAARVTKARTRLEGLAERGQCAAITVAGKRCSRPVGEYRDCKELGLCGPHRWSRRSIRKMAVDG